MTGNIFDLAIFGGDILCENQIIKNGTILVDGEKISYAGINPGQYHTKVSLNVSNKLVMAGVIDSHVHSLSAKKEGFANSTRSALAGGVTTIIDMPLDAPRGISDSRTFKKKVTQLEKDSYIDVALLGSVKNETLQNIPELQSEGVCGFKLSLFDTEPDRFPRVDDGHLLQAFDLIGKTGLTAGIHAENDEIINLLTQKYIEEGKSYPLAHCETRPEVTETESVLRGMEIARAAGARIHLYHLSCSRSVDLARYYRNEGCPVTLETCPHYLLFTQDDVKKLGRLLKINPPVRKKNNSDRLWQKLEAGEIDCIGSDHVPWPLEQKSHQSIFRNLSGVPGVEVLLPILFSEGVIKKRISINTLSKVLMENPARIFGLFPRKGILAPDSDADIVIIDPQKRWVVYGDEMHSSAKWTPYEGMEIFGQVETTIVRGTIMFHEGEIVGKRGFGSFIRPSKKSYIYD